MAFAGCAKDKENNYISPNAFTDSQKKVLDLLHNTWQRHGSIIFDSTFYVFLDQYDTNTIVYGNDYVQGQQELYKYQGIVRFLSYRSNGDTAFCDEYHYYVWPNGDRLYFYRANSDRAYYKYDLKVQNETHFSLLNRDNNSGTWDQWYKVY